MPKRWEAAFPNLGKYEETSSAAASYNCIAWAAGDDTKRWDPDAAGQFYWPDNVPRTPWVHSFIEAFKSIGYEPCGSDDSVEAGYDKVAVYADPNGLGKHVALQLPNGKWTSKLGKAEDITHDTPESLSSQVYGQPFCYMRRPKN